MKKNVINLPLFNKVLRAISLKQLKKIIKDFKKATKNNDLLCAAIIALMLKIVEKEIARRSKSKK